MKQIVLVLMVLVAKVVAAHSGPIPFLTLSPIPIKYG